MREHKEATTQEIPCVVASFFISWHRQVETPGQISRRSYRPLGQSKSQANRLGSSGSALVEAGGVEPPSENVSTGTSPGAVGHLHSLTQAWADTLRGLVASLFMVRSKLCAHTCTTKRRPVPARGPSGRDGHGLSRDKLNVIVVL